MNRIHRRLFSFAVLSVALVAVTPTFTGCATKDRPLAAEGVYQGDNALYNADRVIAESYDAMHSFVLFEYNNREALANQPDIRKSADNIRLNAKRWTQSAVALRDAYAMSPTGENRDKLNDAVRILRTAVLQANTYLAKGIPTK